MSETTRHVLVVEDDVDLARAIADLLFDEGFVVTQCHDGDAGLAAAMQGHFNIILLDLMLPKRNGFRLCQEIRGAGILIPILILTAKFGDLDEIEGLEVGADDFVRKPFEWPILLARMNALLRRAERDQNRNVVVDNVVLNTSSRCVSVGAVESKLTAREFRVLEYLMERPDHTVTKAEILEVVWGTDFDGDPNVVEVYVGYLRRKIDDQKLNSRIKTIRGVGYVFLSGV